MYPEIKDLKSKLSTMWHNNESEDVWRKKNASW